MLINMQGLVEWEKIQHFFFQFNLAFSVTLLLTTSAVPWPEYLIAINLEEV